jgi:sulfatase modifying factor 1
MRIFKTGYNYKIAFFLLLILYSCNNRNTKINLTESTSAVKKETCAACKTLSRTAMLKAAADNIPAEGNSSKDEMVLIKGGSFQMGSNDFPDARPLHTVAVNSFWMDAHEVTNAQFAAFVKATGYITVAEQKLNPADYPGVPAEQLVPGSAVFSPPNNPVSLNDPLQWWKYVPGADWKHPKGPNSNINGKENDPVVQVCYTDAIAYAKWAGKRLPTEAEWEYAARAGKQNEKYYWGSQLKPGNKWPANIFQGSFPYKNLKEDGYDGVAPVKSFPPNAFGLYDMEGNVWEWCNDFYRPDYYSHSSAKNPQGPKDSYDPEEPGVVKHVQRGGSFLCSDEYCIRYKAGSRGKGETNSAGNNLGFRCVKDDFAKQ